MADINDVFDNIFLAEENTYEEGYAEGILKGKEVGLIDGYHLGVKKGSEIGAEIGLYYGCVDTWRQLQKANIIPKKSRLDKALLALEKLLTNFPTENILTDDVMNRLFEIRAKHKQILSLLEIPQTLSGKDGSF